MTDPRDTEPTMPLLPDSGYRQPQASPFAEETLVEPLPHSWPQAADPGRPDNYRQPGAGYGQTDYSQPGAGHGQTGSNYRQPEVGYQSYQPYPASPAAGSAPAWADPSPIPAPQPARPPAPPVSEPTPWQAAPPVPYYGFAGPVPDHPSSTIALVLGILGIVGFWPVAPFAWYLGAKGKRELRQYPGRWGGSGGLTAGVVLGAIVSILMCLVGALFLLIMLVAMQRYP